MAFRNAVASFTTSSTSSNVEESSLLPSNAEPAKPSRRCLPQGIVSLESIALDTSFTNTSVRETVSIDLAGQPHESVGDSEDLCQRRGSSSSQEIDGEFAFRSYLQTLRTTLPIVLVDITLLSLLTLALCAGGRSWLTVGTETPVPDAVLSVLLIYAVVGGLLGIFRVAGLHPVSELRKGLITGSLAIAVSAVFGSIGGSTVTSRLLIGMVGLPAFAFVLPVSRSLGRAVMSKCSWWGVRAVIVGEGQQANALNRFFLSSTNRGIRPIGLIRVANHFSLVDREGVVVNDANEDRLGSLNEIGELQRQHDFTWVIVTSDASSRVDVSDVVAHLHSPAQVLVVPSGERLPSLWCETNDLGGVIGIRWNDKLRRPLPNALKRSTDLALSVMALVVLFPLFAVISVLIRTLSPGPIFYAHERIGRSGRRFRTWKFRTMVPNAEQRLEEVLRSDPERLRQWKEDQKLREDPRIVPIVGRFLRKTSLDELPQLWNVAVGEMSMVGPRPIVEDEIGKYGNEFQLYLLVRPGITGLWQVSGRNDTTYDERVSLDRFYVRNWSLSLDLYLLCRTIRTTFFCEGAY